MFSGTEDTIVNPGVMFKLQSYYSYYIPSSSNVQFVSNIPAEHSFVTNNYGNNCSFLGSPYINNCNFDTAGSILQFIYGRLNSPTKANPNNIVKVNQAQFIPDDLPAVDAGLSSTAYAYVPSNCTTTRCNVHIAFHGCHQTVDEIGNIFYMNAGYNEWAESNQFIILYPQAVANELNPNGCFDWWGYTGPAYATKLGPQMATVKAMADYIRSGL